jgi:hypothetical protein
VAGGDNPGRNLCYLLGLLAETEDDLGKSLTLAPVVIDASKAQVLKRGLAYKLKEPGVCGLRRKRAGPDLFEQGAELVTIHRP